MEDLVVGAKRDDSHASMSLGTRACSWSVHTDPSTELSFHDDATGQCYSLDALTAQEKDNWQRELEQRSNEAREARDKFVALQRWLPVTERPVSGCIARLFINVLELKLARGDYLTSVSQAVAPSASVIDLKRLQNSNCAFASNICVQIQHKRIIKEINTRTNKKEMLAVSKAFKTGQVILDTSPKVNKTHCVDER